jgi:2-polyprenyl-3-methyl-5-hydroxy-6-metoxy-1,4-benzoquinol methylase
MNQPDDLVRMLKEYEDRKRHFAGRDLYSRFNLENYFAIQQRQRAMLNVFQENRFVELSKLKILEMGCGNGGILLEFLGFGLMPNKRPSSVGTCFRFI